MAEYKLKCTLFLTDHSSCCMAESNECRRARGNKNSIGCMGIRSCASCCKCQEKCDRKKLERP